MARKSVKEILEAARKGGPASAAAGASPAPEAAAPRQLDEEAGPVSSAAPARPAAKPAPAATAAAPGRPLSLKEKLAAARGGAAPAALAAASVPPPTAEPEGNEPVTVAESPAAAAEVPTPAQPGRPLTLQEKMAAARAKAAPGGVTGGAAVAAKPAAAKAATKAAPKRTLPPLSEISDPRDLAEALRQAAAKREAETAATKAAARELPARPAREKESKPQSVLPRPSKAALAGTAPAPATDARRRGFLVLSGLAILWIAWGSFFAGVAMFTAMLGRFMFPNVLAEPPSTIKVGVKENYDPEAVNERFKAEWGFWIVRSTRYDGQDIIYALKSVCTHLGCPPNWLEGEQKLKCPCHGSGFYISGVNFEGPAPRPLERFKVTLADDGQIVVDKSQIFQEERDQWSDPDSFIKVV
jgi:cytochrome b6-f complex iron-sulfur subunit